MGKGPCMRISRKQQAEAEFTRRSCQVEIKVFSIPDEFSGRPKRRMCPTFPRINVSGSKRVTGASMAGATRAIFPDTQDPRLTCECRCLFPNPDIEGRTG